FSLLAAAIGAVAQLHLGEVDETVPRLDQFLADVAERRQFLPQLGIVVITDEADPVAGPAADDGLWRQFDASTFQTGGELQRVPKRVGTVVVHDEVVRAVSVVIASA